MIQTFLIPAILIRSKNLNISKSDHYHAILTHHIAKKSPGTNTMVVDTKTVLAVVTPGFTKQCLSFGGVLDVKEINPPLSIPSFQLAPPSFDTVERIE